MTDQVFTMTMAQMKAMFNAGVSAGESSATAYNCGSWHSGTDNDFVEAVFDVVNEGFKWGQDGYTEWDQVEAMVKGK